MATAKTKIIGGAAMAAMLAVATPAIKHYEGYSATPYRDVIGKLTVCYGETNVRMRRYSRAECDAMLNGHAAEYGAAVAKRNPSLVGHPWQWAAATSLAYNIGVANYVRSTVARLFDAGRWRDACNHFKDWKYAGGRVNKGLVNRRQDETRLCLTRLPPA